MEIQQPYYQVREHFCAVFLWDISDYLSKYRKEINRVAVKQQLSYFTE